MKNVVLIGDSIRAGYDKSVQKTLDGRANVIFAKDSGRFAAYLLRYLHVFLESPNGEEIDVIHWNAGLWDCLHMFGEDVLTPIDIYKYYIERICVRMKSLCPNAKVIFATSTSVLTEKMEEPFKRYNHDIEAYNQAAVEIVKKYGFQVNDLYALSCTLPEEAHNPDGVHFYTPMGTEALTNQVLSYLLPALGIEEKLEYREQLHTDAPVGI